MRGSEGLYDFLNYVRESVETYKIAEGDVAQYENETQDLLHSLELENNSYHESARIARTLAEVRQQRRISKDIMTVIKPLFDWVNDNGKTINSLERLLGDMRKAEKIKEKRSYFYRTDIVKTAKEQNN